MLSSASAFLDREKVPEARCHLQIAEDLDPLEINTTMRAALKQRIEEREKLTEHEQQLKLEKQIAAIKAEVQDATEQAMKIQNAEEKQAIEDQIEVQYCHSPCTFNFSWKYKFDTKST